MNIYFNVMWLGAMVLSTALPTAVFAKNHHKKHHSSSSSSASSTESCPKQKSFKGGARRNQKSLSPWIKKEGDVFVYKFNVFNLATNDISMKTLESIFEAQKKDIKENYRKDYGIEMEYKLYPAEEVNNPDLFKGDRIPFFIIESGPEVYLAQHCAEPTPDANEGSFVFGGCSIYDSTGIQVPSNFPYYTPYASAITSVYKANSARQVSNNNPYGIQCWEQNLSFGISHELKEIFGDDDIQNWVVFDSFAPTTATWHYAEFDENGNCINGTIGPDGYVHLPLFSDVAPYGGIFTTIQENGDVVSRSSAGQLHAYKVDGWSMTNYPVSNFWKGYYESDKIKWDKKGFVENPLQPYGGLHEIIFFLDYESGYTYVGDVNNFGPVTYSQRGASPANNFPPDYTYVEFFFSSGGMPEAGKDFNMRNFKRSATLPKQKTISLVRSQ